MKRSIDIYQKCDPDEMSQMSRAAIFYALRDMRDDILALHEALRRLSIVASVADNDKNILDNAKRELWTIDNKATS